MEKKSAGLLQTVSQIFSPLILWLLLLLSVTLKVKCCAASRTTDHSFALRVPAAGCPGADASLRDVCAVDGRNAGGRRATL